MRRSLPESSLQGSERASYRILSRASEAVGDEFSQEDLLVGVDGVDDEGEQLRDLSLELEGLTTF